MQIQHAPTSPDKETVVIASRDSGGFWKSLVFSPDTVITRDVLGDAVTQRWIDWDGFDAALIDAQLRDEHYISLDGRDVSEAEARSALKSA